MKLIPKARPVNIRISSGGEEHSSLESLRRNFVWSDVCKLFEERALVKWLLRLNEKEKAAAIEECESPRGNPVRVYDILFGGDTEFRSVKDILEASITDPYVRTFAATVLHYCDVETAALLHYSREVELKDVISRRLVDIVESSNFDIPADELFEIGVRLVETEFKSIGVKCLKKSSSKGCYKARKFLADNQLGEVTDQDIYDLYADERIKAILSTSWDTRQPISFANFDQAEKQLFEFSNICLRILTATGKSGHILDGYDIACRNFDSITPSSVLYQEKMFVLAMLHWTDNRIYQTLDKIPDYPPVKYMRNEKFKLAGGCEFRCRYPVYNIDSLKYFVNNLPKFSLYRKINGKSGV